VYRRERERAREVDWAVPGAVAWVMGIILLSSVLLGAARTSTPYLLPRSS
jgi:hypothetical protein